MKTKESVWSKNKRGISQITFASKVNVQSLAFVYFTLDAYYKVKSHFIILPIRRVKSFFLSQGTQISFTFTQDTINRTQNIQRGFQDHSCFRGGAFDGQWQSRTYRWEVLTGE